MRTKEFWIEQFGESWTMFLKELLKSPYMDKLMSFINIEYAMGNVYPKEKKAIFKNFRATPLEKIKIVILSDAPQFNSSVANGPYADCFIDGYHNGSLRIIGECIQRQFGLNLEFDYSLGEWEEQGVLLLNKTLTTKLNEPFAHTKPWDKFIRTTIDLLVKHNTGLIFIVWGDEDFKSSFIPTLVPNQHVFSWEHPHAALLERRDWNCPNFKQVNELLTYLNGEKETIKW